MIILHGQITKVDILAIGAHPDDIELGCGGTLLKHIYSGYKIGLVDITCGELGTNGDKETRIEESRNAAIKMGAVFRVNLELPDGQLLHYSFKDVLKLISLIREAKPNVILTTSEDRHPDHTGCARLTYEAAFLSGLRKININGTSPSNFQRPEFIYSYIQFIEHTPNFVVDISDVIEKKIEVLECYQSQFSPNGNPTLLNVVGIKELVLARAKSLGYRAFLQYAEGFTSKTLIQVDDIVASSKNKLLSKKAA